VSQPVVHGAPETKSLDPFWRRLYVRIWVAVVLMVAVLTLLVGWLWRLTAEPPLREMVVRNHSGEVVGYGLPRRAAAHLAASSPLHIVPDPEAAASAAAESASVPHPAQPGPEFKVIMEDGRTLYVHLPRPPGEPRSPWTRWPFDFAWSLVLVGVAVALTIYPILRQLTRRLDSLRQGVERWGQGDLSVRVPVRGNDEVAFLSLGFNQAAQHIENLVAAHTDLLARQQALLQAQKSLLANASHELRSPLARIRMGVELLGDGAAPNWRDELNRNIAELDQLIDEILLASRLDTHGADIGSMETVDLLGLAAEESGRSGAQLNVSASDTQHRYVVRGVNRLLRRLIRNLLENATRYGQDEITVSLQTSGGHLILSVCDRGPGVPEDQRERIFEPFYRLPGASEREGGVGLGLALVKSIVQRHQGSVRCESHVGGGAYFVVELPLAPPTA